MHTYIELNDRFSIQAYSVLESATATLDDYYHCRTLRYKELMTREDEIAFCANQLIGVGRETAAEYIALILGRINEAREGFYACVETEGDEQAHCFVHLYGEIRPVVQGFLALIEERDEEIFTVVAQVLDTYYECRIEN